VCATLTLRMTCSSRQVRSRARRVARHLHMRLCQVGTIGCHTPTRICYRKATSARRDSSTHLHMRFWQGGDGCTARICYRKTASRAGVTRNISTCDFERVGTGVEPTLPHCSQTSPHAILAEDGCVCPLSTAARMAMY
jgi:hypothetical protein